MMRQRRGDAGAAGDIRHGDVERAALADGRDCGVDQRRRRSGSIPILGMKGLGHSPCF
jgi:hypothetical protein